MSADQPTRSLSRLLCDALLFGWATAALWLATAVVLPSVKHVMHLHGTRVPAFFAPALSIQTVCYHAVVPIAVGGGVCLVLAWLGRGPARLVIAARTALALLSGLVAGLALYLLGSGGVAYKLASIDQVRETKFYKQTLDQFALLEAAQGRYDELREAFLKTRDLKMVEVRSASEFSDEEARDRVSRLMGALSKATDPAMKRRLLATLCLFRERIRRDSYEARDLPRHALEAGAPATRSHVETLEWIAANLNKDGWEPIPLFKLGR